MPYIQPDQREQLDHAIETLIIAIMKVTDNGRLINPPPGIYNYVITQLLNRGFNHTHYSDYNTTIGILECAKLEFYRRAAAPYEDAKILENGDVY